MLKEEKDYAEHARKFVEAHLRDYGFHQVFIDGVMKDHERVLSWYVFFIEQAR